MADAHWWCTRPNSITQCATTLMKTRVLPLSLRERHPLAIRLATFLIWPSQCTTPNSIRQYAVALVKRRVLPPRLLRKHYDVAILLATFLVRPSR